MVMGQEERKNKAKLEKTQIQLASSSNEYDAAVKTLEDTTGRLSGSQFVDIHERMKFAYRCTRQDMQGTQFCIYELSSPRDDAYTRPVVTLDFGANNTLGMINYGTQYIKMDNYLYKASPPGRCVFFVAPSYSGSREVTNIVVILFGQSILRPQLKASCLHRLERPEISLVISVP